jgi:hypothetical protein
MNRNTTQVSSHVTPADGAMQCVLREVNGLMQYVPIDEVHPSLRVAGERLFIGTFSCDVVSSGPHGSHKRNICTPLRTTETTLVLNN